MPTIKEKNVELRKWGGIKEKDFKKKNLTFFRSL